MASVLSDPINGGFQKPDEKGRRLCRSGFNLRWFHELSVEPRVIFDVGSFDGADALRFKRAYPKAMVIAVEADPARASAIRKNLAGESIILIEAAIVDMPGTIPLHHSNDQSELGSRCASIYQWPKKPLQDLITVEAITLFSICSELWLASVDLLHMDIEGAELLAIRGLGPIRPKLIWAEVWDGWTGAPGSEATHAAIIKLGYRHLLTSKADRLYIHG